MLLSEYEDANITTDFSQHEVDATKVSFSYVKLSSLGFTLTPLWFEFVDE